ncbi:DUF3857 domain-containing protein [Membranihabitans marinus]|uniref:DUF3857 domain-containing protein n=1 Tax=Membranihabitans marinus TaxID=1227546 RepID=UPI001F31C5AB|nr:DUF3857 domain-containing protein [Membranihabitans marinus]
MNLIYQLRLFLFLHYLLLLLPTTAQVLNYETVITIDKNGKKVTYKSLVIQINDSSKKWQSEIAIDYKPFQKFKLNHGHIQDIHGNVVRKIKKNEIVTRNNPSSDNLYSDHLISEFDLNWNEYPYQISYSYTIEEEEYLNVINWIPLIFYETATKKASLTISTPQDYQLKIRQSEEFTYSESIDKNIKTQLWTIENIQLESQDIFCPAMIENLPQVYVLPQMFNYHVEGSYTSWKTYGAWQAELNKDSDILPASEKVKVDILIQDIKDTTEIIKTLYYYLQDHTTYVNVDIDVGGLKTYPAEYVCKNKYGDCKALSTYMKAMLNHVGIESRYMNIIGGKNPKRIVQDFPSQQFNHAIVMVPLKNDSIWLENTSNYLPFNYLGSFTQNRYGLIIDKDDSKLVRSPSQDKMDVLLKRSFTFIQKDDESWENETVLQLRGDSFDKMRYFNLKNEKENQEKEIENILGIKDFKIDKFDWLNYHRDSTFLDILVKGTSAALIRSLGKYRVLSPLSIEIPTFENPSSRKQIVRFNIPIHKSDTTVYKLNSESENEIKLPKEIELKNRFGQYSAKFENRKNEIHVKERFLLYRGDILLDEYEEFYSFIETIDKYKQKSSILIQ